MALWIVGLVNAFNMLDNMDALSGGVAWIAAGMFALALLLRQEGPWDWQPVIPFVILMGALTGFLWFNLPPARIFMGDAGSTFLGFFLGSRSLEESFQDSAGPFPWLVPLCILLLVAAAVMVWPSAEPVPAHPAAGSHLLDGLREYVARRG